MKHNIHKAYQKAGSIAATALACAVVLGVPLLSVLQWGHFSIDHRKVSALSAFQPRSVDKTSKPIALFQEPLVTVTFDDGWESTYTQALPLLNKYGIHSTQFIISGEDKDQDYLSWAQIKQMEKDGQEIGCHTVSHPNLTTLSNSDVMKQLQGCQDTMVKELGHKVVDFASPYGAANDQTITDIKKVFKSQRNTNGDASNGVTDADVNLADNFNPYNIIGMTIKRDTTPQQIQAMLDYAKAHNGWVVLTYHQAETGQEKFGIDPKSLDEQLSLLSKSDVRIVTMQQVITAWEAAR